MRFCFLLCFGLLLYSCSGKQDKTGSEEFNFAVTYYPDSTLKEIAQMRNGLLEGKAFRFTEYGAKLWEFNYENDQQEGIQYYYVNGRLTFEALYKNNKRNGWAKRYSGPCGDISEEGQYINDKMDGLWYEYHDRELLEICLYENGSLVKVIYRNSKYPDRNSPLPPITKDCADQWRSEEE
jgi:antitoxin component YwqK of YwqJK toxin-antitoxin module